MTNSPSKDKPITYTATYRINKEYLERLTEYSKLPWYKRLFKRIPKS